jgi:hypothetical protein
LTLRDKSRKRGYQDATQKKEFKMTVIEISGGLMSLWCIIIVLWMGMTLIKYRDFALAFFLVLPVLVMNIMLSVMIWDDILCQA